MCLEFEEIGADVWQEINEFVTQVINCCGVPYLLDWLVDRKKSAEIPNGKMEPVM